MRARLLSPRFFTSRQVINCPPLARILFEGLWCAADRVGVLLDDPWRFKLDILPGDDVDVDALLDTLAASPSSDGIPLIVRYQVNDLKYIAIPKFGEYQHPHPREATSRIPPPPTRTRQPSTRQDLGDALPPAGYDLGDVKPGGLSGPSDSQAFGGARVREGSAEDDDPRLVAIGAYEAALADRGLSPPTAADRRIIGRHAGGLLEEGKDLRDVLSACREAARTGQTGLVGRYCAESERDRLGIPRGERHEAPPPPRPPRPLIPTSPPDWEAQRAGMAAVRNGSAALRAAVSGNGSGDPPRARARISAPDAPTGSTGNSPDQTGSA